MNGGVDKEKGSVRALGWNSSEENNVREDVRQVAMGENQTSKEVGNVSDSEQGVEKGKYNEETKVAARRRKPLINARVELAKLEHDSNTQPSYRSRDRFWSLDG
jgi:hypothetical protein